MTLMATKRCSNHRNGELESLVSSGSQNFFFFCINEADERYSLNIFGLQTLEQCF